MNKTLTAIDLFAGIGGFSTGAKAAGVQVLLAANHWPKAVEFHQLNHPEVIHECQDLRQIDWNKVPDHDILMASPCCQGHSLARGRDTMKADISRQTAWCVIEGLSYKRPKYFVVENVVEFTTWELFDIWQSAVERLGYTITINKLNSADFGVPQTRKRLFIVGALGKSVKVESPNVPHIPANDILEWDSGEFRPIEEYGEVIKRQIKPARERYGDRFLVTSYSSSRNGRDPRKPIGTMTTNNHFYLVKGDKIRPLSVREYHRAMGFPENYVLPKQATHAKKMLGNAVCPDVIKSIITQIIEQDK